MSAIYLYSVYVQIKLPCKKRFPFPLLIVKLQHSEVLDQLVQVRVESCTALDNFIYDSHTYAVILNFLAYEHDSLMSCLHCGQWLQLCCALSI